MLFLQQHSKEKVIVYFLTCNCVDFYALALKRLGPKFLPGLQVSAASRALLIGTPQKGPRAASLRNNVAGKDNHMRRRMGRAGGQVPAASGLPAASGPRVLLLLDVADSVEGQSVVALGLHAPCSPAPARPPRTLRCAPCTAR